MQRCNDLHHAWAFARDIAYANEEIEIEARAATFSFVLHLSLHLFFMYIISPAGSCNFVCNFVSLRNLLVLISTKLEIMSSTILISQLLLSYFPKNRSLCWFTLIH